MSLSFEDGMKELGKMLEKQMKDGNVPHDTVIVEASDSTGVPTPSVNIVEYNPLDGGVTSFELLAAATEDQENIISKQYMSVDLDSEEKNSYEKFFYPRSPSVFIPIFPEIAKVSARINGFFSLLRYGLEQAVLLSTLTPEERASNINEKAQRILNNVVSNDNADSIKRFLESSSSGNSHVIYPSDKYEGGFDIDFIGPLSAADGNYDIGNIGSIFVPYNDHYIQPVVPYGMDEDETYKSRYLERYSTELSQGLIKTGKMILELLLGDEAVDVKSAPKRIVKRLPLSFDFSKLNDILFDNTGIVLTVDFMENIQPAVVNKFQDYFRLTCVRTPRKSITNEIINEKARVKRNTESRNAYNDNPEPIPEVDVASLLEKKVTKEGMALSQNVSFSFSVSLTKDLAHYITQTEATETVSMLSLHNWISSWSRNVIKRPGARVAGGRTKMKDLPKVVIPLSKAQKISELRVKNNLAIEEGKGDDNNIFIQSDGSLGYGLPATASNIAEDNIAKYEADMEAYIQHCYENGIPVQVSSVMPRDLKALDGKQTDDTEFKTLNGNIRKYSGKLLTYNWDYNTVITAAVENPSAMVPKDLIGSAKLDDLVLADYLGMNFAKDGEEPIQKSFAASMVLMLNHPLRKGNPRNGDPGQTPYEVVGSEDSPSRFIGEYGQEEKGFMGHLLQYYKYLLYKGHVPPAETLIEEAIEELNLTEFDERQKAVAKGAINLETKTPETWMTGNAKISTFLANCLRECISYSAGSYQMRQVVANENPGISAQELRDLIKEHEDYFDPTKPSADFGRLYSLVPGMVWKKAMEHILALDPKILFSADNSVEEGTLKLPQPSYSVITSKILPLATMFAKYIPQAPEIFERAEELKEANTPDESISEDDIKISGGNDDAQMFPHQVATHQALRKRPAFAVLDIGAGGGKTTIGVTDIASMVSELNELGENNIKPLILCPDGLIKNWVDDMKIFTGTKWNMVPINSKIINRWGYEKLDEVLKDAPINTIVVAGFYFLKAKPETISIGTHQIKISNNLEFIKRYGFNYICIDESHKLKSKRSVVHKTVKQLTTASNVRYLRLASGTLISNVVSDIVGQTSLYNGHIFREGEVSDDTGDSVRIGSDDVPRWEVDTPERARQKLGNYASVITKKKKEWAFMLPSPIESFHSVPMVPTMGEGVTPEDIELGELHQQLYDTVLNETEEELEELIDKVKKLSEEQIEKKLDDEAAARAESDEGSDEITDFDIGADEEFAKISQADLEPYLQRIERLITNPMRDPAFNDVFGNAGVSNYHSTKAKYIANNIIKKHFEVTPWERGGHYKEYTLVSHENKLYLSRKLDKSSSSRKLLPESTIGMPPNEDVETWKEEPEGKIIVFCRYTNSVAGIYDALPEEYKKMAVKYTGEEDDKLVNLDAFLNDPRIKILIANEQGISEGHNMQVASRIIRVESPWAPGELEQSTSRIFRPDPKAAKEMVKNGKPGELYREAIFLDWVMADNSMEIPKQARLISKIVQNAQFDESGNTLYADVLESYSGLERIRMGLDLLRSRASFDDYLEYAEGYSAFKAIQREEFHDMRVKGDHSMRDLSKHDEVEGSKKIRTPFVSNQKPADDTYKQVTLRNVLRNPEHAGLLKDIDKIKGLPVVTDMGPGRIASFRVRYKMKAKLDENGQPVYKKTRGGKKSLVKEYVLDANGNKVVDDANPISSVIVKSSETQQPIPAIRDIGSLFVVMDKLTGKDKKVFHVDNYHVTDAQIKKAEKQQERAARKSAKSAERKRKKDEKKLLDDIKKKRMAQKQAKAKRAAQVDKRKRKKNIAEGRPINHGIPKVSKPPKRGGLVHNKNFAVKDEADKKITLDPTLMQGHLNLEIIATDPDAKLLKKFGFVNKGPYAYVDVNMFRRYEKIFDYMEDNFEIPDAYFRLLDDVQDAFEAGQKGIYNMEMAPTSQLKFFFAAQRIMAKKRNQIRPFPIIFPDFLRIAVDIKTNPGIKKHIGKNIPGAVAKWKESPGHYLYFAKNKQELRAKVKELKQAGFIIENDKALNKAITNIKFRAPKTRK